MGMSKITVELLEEYAEMMADSDYSRYPWGGDVTDEVVKAATIVAWREFGAANKFATGDVLEIMTRGWEHYDNVGHMISADTNDEDGADHLNSLMTRWGIPGPERERLENTYVGPTIVKEAQEEGAQTVWFGGSDLPEDIMRRQISSIIIFNQKLG